MPRPRQIERDEMTPFAQLLFDYMVRRIPVLNFSDMADLVGVSTQTVTNWVYLGSIPKPNTLAAIADATGIPLATLYEAAGYRPPQPEDQQVLERIFALLDQHRRAVEKALPDDARAELEKIRGIVRIPKARKTPPLVDGSAGDPPSFSPFIMSGLRAQREP